MENLKEGSLAPDELPAGFTMGATGGGEDDQKKMQREMILEQACTQEALARLGRIRMARESRAKAIEDSIISMALQRRLPGRITEDKLIQLIEGGGSGNGQPNGQGKRISIQRKKYDSDSDDDNDDDL